MECGPPPEGVGEATGLKLPKDRCAADDTPPRGPPASSACALCIRLNDLESRPPRLAAALPPSAGDAACW